MSLPDLYTNFGGFELSTITLLVGVIVATTVRRVTHVNPGGIIAAALFILSVHTSLYWALIIPVMGIVIDRLYTRFLGHVYSGKLPLFIMAFCSVVIMLGVDAVLKHAGLIADTGLNYPVGIILPAILASSIKKQGLKVTYGYALLAVVITAAIVAILYYIGLVTGYNFHDLDKRLETRELMHVPYDGFLYLASIAIGYVIYRARAIKSAGYIVLPFLANLLLVSPVNFLLVTGLAAICYALTSLLRRYSLIVGIGRYAFVFSLSILLVWTAEYVSLYTTKTFSPFLGTSIVASLVIAVIVNEHSIYGLRRSSPLLGTGLAIMTLLTLGAHLTAFEFGTIKHSARVTNTAALVATQDVATPKLVPLSPANAQVVLVRDTAGSPVSF